MPGAEQTPAPAYRVTPGPTNPSAVTVPHAATPLQRARSSWRDTDYVRRLDDVIAAPRLRRCATIAVMSPKGGVGKTTITALLGTLFAHVRRDRTIAIDTNPDYGSLGRTLAPEHGIFVDDVLDILDSSDPSATQLDTQLGRGPDGLLVLPAPTDADRMAKLTRESYQRVIERLQAKAGLLLLDCGTGIQEPAAQAALLAADQLVVVSDVQPATATLVIEASQQLLKSGIPIELVVNKLPRRNVRLDLQRLAELLPEADGMSILEHSTAGAERVAAGTFTWTGAVDGWTSRSRAGLEPHRAGPRSEWPNRTPFGHRRRAVLRALPRGHVRVPTATRSPILEQGLAAVPATSGVHQRLFDCLLDSARCKLAASQPNNLQTEGTSHDRSDRRPRPARRGCRRRGRAAALRRVRTRPDPRLAARRRARGQRPRQLPPEPAGVRRLPQPRLRPARLRPFRQARSRRAAEHPGPPPGSPRRCASSTPGRRTSSATRWAAPWHASSRSSTPSSSIASCSWAAPARSRGAGRGSRTASR